MDDSLHCTLTLSFSLFLCRRHCCTKIYEQEFTETGHLFLLRTESRKLGLLYQMYYPVKVLICVPQFHLEENIRQYFSILMACLDITKLASNCLSSLPYFRDKKCVYMQADLLSQKCKAAMRGKKKSHFLITYLPKFL